MLDFMRIETIRNLGGYDVVFRPRFDATRHPRDIIIKGGKIHSVYDESTGLWNTYDPYSVIDKEIVEFVKARSCMFDTKKINYYTLYDNPVIERELNQYIKYKCDGNSDWELNQRVIFKNDEIKKEDMASMTLSYPVAGTNEDCHSDAWDEFLSEMFHSKEDSDVFEMVIGETLYNGNNTPFDRHRKPIIFTGDGNMWAHVDVLNTVIESIFEGYYCRLSYPVSALSFGSGSPIMAVCCSPNAKETLVDNQEFRSIIRGEEVLVRNKYQKGYLRRYKCRILVMDMDMDLKDMGSYDFGFGEIKIRLNSESNVDFRYGTWFVNSIFYASELSKIARLCMNKYTLNMEKFNNLEGFL